MQTKGICKLEKEKFGKILEKGNRKIEK